MAKTLTLDKLHSDYTDSFRLKNVSKKVAEIHIDGFIGGGFFEMEDDGSEAFKVARTNNQVSMQNELSAISNLGADEIIVHIRSLGGFVDHALAMHDMLAVHPADISVRITGMTASSATVIAMAGDDIEMSDNALFLVHRVTGCACGHADNVRDGADDIQLAEDRLVNIYKKVNRKGRTKSQIKKLMALNDGQGKWISATEAKAEGFIDDKFEPMAMAAVANKKTLKFLNLPQPVNPLNSNTMKIKNLKTFIALLKEKFDALADEDDNRDELLENISDAAKCDEDDVERVLDGDIESEDTAIITALADEFDMTLNELIAEANGEEVEDDDPDDENESTFDQIYNWLKKKFNNKKVTSKDLKAHSKTIAKKLDKQYNEKIEELENELEASEEKYKKRKKTGTQKKNVKNGKGLTLDNIGDPDARGEKQDNVSSLFLESLNASQRLKLKNNKKKAS